LTHSQFEPERFRSPDYLAVIDAAPATARILLCEQAEQLIREEAEKGYPLEICGLLIGRLADDGWHVSQARPVANLNSERAADRFQLDPAGYQAIDRELRGSGEEIIGVYHSHPDCPARPSPTDLGSAWEGFAYPIISVCEGDAKEILGWCINSTGSAFMQTGIEVTR